MDEGALVGRVVDPGSAVPKWFPDAVSPPAAAVSTPDAEAHGVLAQPAMEVDGPGAVAAVNRFRVWLARVDMDSFSDRERVELVANLERVKGASSAAQARATDALRCSREVVSPQDVARSVGSVVALARRESPTLGDRFVGLSRALVHEMPATMQALSDGECGERVAVAVVAATATLSLEDRAEVDARVGPLLGRLGVKQAGAAAARVASELDAASVVARMEAAVKSRRVSVRPAPDGMAYLTVLGPLKDVVGAHVALRARARGVVGGQCPDEHPEGRGVGAVAADTALRLLSGRAVGQLQPVEVHLVMTDRSLLGTGDPDRSPFEPARIPGHGSVPGPVARAWLHEGLGEPPPSRSDAASVSGTALEPASGARVWVRRLYTSPDGRDLVAMDSRRRLFGGLLRRMLVLRDDVCTSPWCEAPIVHADHATPVRELGETSFEEGNGKCARCNYGKDAPGWRTRVVLRQFSSSSISEVPGCDRTDDRDLGQLGALLAKRVVQVTTPLGHGYESEPPPLLGWGSLTVPPARALPAVHEETHVTSGAPVGPSPSGAPEGTPATSSAPAGPSLSSTPEVHGAIVERAPEPMDTPKSTTKQTPALQIGSRRPAEGSGWPSVQRRKRPLRRSRTILGPFSERPRRERRAWLTSHLERELCRYLT